MTVRLPPSWLQTEDHPAEQDRLLLASLLTSPMTAFAGGVSALDPGHGVVHAGDLAVTATGTPDMNVNVAAGAAFIRGTLSAFQGVYQALNDASYALTMPAADATNPRRILIILEVRDSSYDGTDDDARLVAVVGAPAAAPVDPSLAAYPNALVLARISQPASAPNIQAGYITDLRTRAIGRGGVLGAATPVTANQTGLGAGPTDLTGLSVTVNVCANRRIRVTGYAVLRNGESAANSGQLLIVADGTVVRTVPAGLVSTASTGVKEGVGASIDITAPSAGSHTYKLQSTFAAGSANLMEASATQPATLVVEDLGPI
jgi:hypothetical protein